MELIRENQKLTPQILEKHLLRFYRLNYVHLTNVENILISFTSKNRNANCKLWDQLHHSNKKRLRWSNLSTLVRKFVSLALTNFRLWCRRILNINSCKSILKTDRSFGVSFIRHSTNFREFSSKLMIGIRMIAKSEHLSGHTTLMTLWWFIIFGNHSNFAMFQLVNVNILVSLSL